MTNPASKRRRLIDDLVDQAFADASADPDTAMIAAWMRELPMATDVDPIPEQAQAWRELAELATDPHFRQKLRTLALAAADRTPSKQIDVSEVTRRINLCHSPK